MAAEADHCSRLLPAVRIGCTISFFAATRRLLLPPGCRGQLAVPDHARQSQKSLRAEAEVARDAITDERRR